MNFAMLFPLSDPYAEASAFAWGMNVDVEADRLIDNYATLGYQSPSYHAEKLARAYALMMDDQRKGFGAAGLTTTEQQGLRMQAEFWRDVCDEIRAREEA